MKPNVLLCGKTGTGKSSLINFIFNKVVADLGTAEAQTRGIKFYSSDDINIYDSEGYEIGDKKQRHFHELIFNDFLEKKKNSAVSDRLHAVWYTVSAAGTRFEDIDNQYLNMIQKNGFPVCILLTKIDEVSEPQLKKLSEDIHRKQPNLSIFNLSTKEHVQEYCHFKELMDWSKVIPEKALKNFRKSIDKSC